jgi:uncharacterized membrane protein YqjE
MTRSSPRAAMTNLLIVLIPALFRNWRLRKSRTSSPVTCWQAESSKSLMAL